MDLQTAKEEAIRVFGPCGHARAVRVTVAGRFQMDYRVGIYSRGRYQDHGRGTTWERAFDQYATTVYRLQQRLERLKTQPSKAQKKIAAMQAQREMMTPPLRSHTAQLLAEYRRSA